MAIYHCTSKPLGRRSGRSAVAASAYRRAVRLVAADGQAFDYRRKRGVIASWLTFPDVGCLKWCVSPGVLWRAAEAAESRRDARVAREWIVAVPCELPSSAARDLVVAFAQAIASRFGVAVDAAIHAPAAEGDARNLHAHLLATTRVVTAEGLGAKAEIERQDKALKAAGLPPGRAQIEEMRHVWETLTNTALARAGINAQVDRRSHEARGIGLHPTRHMGPEATALERQARRQDLERFAAVLAVDSDEYDAADLEAVVKERAAKMAKARGCAPTLEALFPDLARPNAELIVVRRGRLDAGSVLENAAQIEAKPSILLDIITEGQSVFDRHDVARALNRAIDGDAALFAKLLPTVMASPELVTLAPVLTNKAGVEVGLARLTTREMVAVEADLARLAGDLARDRRHQARRVAATRRDRFAAAGLSEEQIRAALHATDGAGLAAVVGVAGAGKSTLLREVRAAYEAGGCRVFGAALSGKAADGLEAASGIMSRTIASWQSMWEQRRGLMRRGDVLVIDEAGMVGSRQLRDLLRHAETAGAKVILVGDQEQLQPIQAGAAFRAVVERVGSARLDEVWRQREAWQRQATQAFAAGRTQEGLQAYWDHGAISFSPRNGDAIKALAAAYLADRDAHREASRLALAYRRAEVKAINEAIREGLVERGVIGAGADFWTADGPERFGVGDRIAFGRNDYALGVRNGQLGVVTGIAGGQLTIKLDGGGEVTIADGAYIDIAHGYAVTIHKSQGATVDRAFVLVGDRMDRHLTYVSLSRHRESVELYAGRDQFTDFEAIKGSLSRSGKKETTLEYGASFAARRGLPIADTLRAASGVEAKNGLRSGLRQPGLGAPAPMVVAMTPAMTM